MGSPPLSLITPRDLTSAVVGSGRGLDPRGVAPAMSDGAEPDPRAVYTSTPNILHPHLCQLPFTLFGVEGQINQDKRLLFTLTGLSWTNYF